VKPVVPLFAAIAALLVANAQAAAPEAARRLAQEAGVVDTHIDAPTELLRQWTDLGLASDREFDFPKAQAGGLAVGFMSIYTSADQDDAGQARQVANTQIDAVEALVQRHPDKFALLRSPRDVARLRAGGHVLLALGMENGAPIVDDLAQLQRFHDRGVRYITLAHSRGNRIADSSYSQVRQWHGLSPFGRQVVPEMNRLGIMVDVSHLSDESASEAIALSRVPVIASHSAFRHFTPGFERNISDELAKAVAAKGGVVQVSFGTPFINPKAAADIVAYFTAVASSHPRDVEAFQKTLADAHPAPETHLESVLD
jgi:membrane dipeptidase